MTLKRAIIILSALTTFAATAAFSESVRLHDPWENPDAQESYAMGICKDGVATGAISYVSLRNVTFLDSPDTRLRLMEDRLMIERQGVLFDAGAVAGNCPDEKGEREISMAITFDPGTTLAYSAKYGRCYPAIGPWFTGIVWHRKDRLTLAIGTTNGDLQLKTTHEHGGIGYHECTTRTERVHQPIGPQVF